MWCSIVNNDLSGKPKGPEDICLLRWKTCIGPKRRRDNLKSVAIETQALTTLHLIENGELLRYGFLYIINHYECDKSTTRTLSITLKD